MNRNDIADALGRTLKETNFQGIGELYRGKVRDVYKSNDQLVLITSDRVSAFDRVLGTIPFKGQILNAIAVEAFEHTKDIVPNHLVKIPDPNVMVTKLLKPYAVEFVVREYITGSLWRDYEANKVGYGLELPKNLKRDQRLPNAPILTPSTKAEQGEHDEPISKAEIIERCLMTKAQLDEAEAVALRLFERGSKLAKDRGLILVDTKYELGLDESGTLTLIDEVHTPDSSRYWVRDEYEARFEKGESQKMLDKENLRQWLIEKHNFSGHGEAPALDDEIRVFLAEQYAKLYEQLTGRDFQPAQGEPVERIRNNLKSAGLPIS